MAFCFYNLSSIINGLVYFDQFALIPQIHLILVIVGIVILLGGVWVVSIQSGEGGVDVGTWAEGDGVAVFDGESEVCDVEVQDGIEGESTREREEVDLVGEETAWRRRERLKKRESRSESNVDTVLSVSPERIGTILGLGQPSTRRVVVAPSSSPPPMSAMTRSRSTSPSPRLRTRRRRPTMDGHPYVAHAQTFAESLGGQHSRPHSQVSISGIGPGFHIGLSPLSPGFAIMPRRRRISGLGANVGDRHTVTQVEGMGSGAEGGRRRTVSEGDLGRQVNMMDDDGEEEEEEEEETEVGMVVEVGRGDKGKGKGKGLGRWRWLKKLTGRR